jgi:hypothetical protein
MARCVIMQVYWQRVRPSTDQSRGYAAHALGALPLRSHCVCTGGPGHHWRCKSIPILCLPHTRPAVARASTAYVTASAVNLQSIFGGLSEVRVALVCGFDAALMWWPCIAIMLA